MELRIPEKPPDDIIRMVVEELNDQVLRTGHDIMFRVSYWQKTMFSILFTAEPCEPTTEVHGEWVFKFLIPYDNEDTKREIHLNRQFRGREGLAVGKYFWKLRLSCLGGRKSYGYFMRKYELGDFMEVMDEVTVPQIHRMFAGVCKGLYAIHGLGMVHNDVKLSNMFLDAQYNGYLADFGRVCSLDIDTHTTSEIHATFLYMAPEMAKAMREKSTYAFNGKADVWAMGYCMYIMFTQEFLFNGSDCDVCTPRFLQDVFDRTNNPVFKWEIEGDLRNAGVDEVCIDFICRCMTVDPERRMSINECMEHEYIRSVSAHMSETDELPEELFSSAAPRNV